MRGIWARVLMGLAMALTALTPAMARDARAPLVLAAASLQESLTAAADAWAAKGHARPTISFAASSALARQIDAGAPADIFISADEPWMDDVQKNGHVAPGTRVSFLANRLVLIAPATSKGSIAIRKGFPLAQALGDGRLAMADPDSVPAGKYGKAALTALGVWPQVEPKVARGDSVRAALAFVERGEAPYGIVYETDAKASRAVRIAGIFPENTHPAVTYPIARLTGSASPEAEGFRRFLLSSAGRAIFQRYGFLTHRP
ncbi:molybdate ABC transporter substrate-binding protein [Sphingomonas oligoaromativorans]|uniref:molybdate ABC transporter substrate-binding protein n=1 Tax=Sphingomonas oligoaromativorans TaxID=575322 RepID=UPI0014245D10|nr:molybdate ABC transporter substrate-binding protein [Sphingomonas oligoaromativorans]NIJ35018.1 molybdate transport system substrate-binding protein [Sphingomonas oligoaromativorans]